MPSSLPIAKRRVCPAIPSIRSWCRMASRLSLANPLCVLMLQVPEVINPNDSTVNALPAEGRPEYHVGSRIITGRQGNMLTVNAPFNQVSQNVGANVGRGGLSAA